MEKIIVECDDDTYVYGTMFAERKEDTLVEPYYSFDDPRYGFSDKESYLTLYYPSVNQFLVYKRKIKNETQFCFQQIFDRYEEISEHVMDLIFSDVFNSVEAHLNFDLFDYQLFQIVHTGTCYSEDFDLYEIENEEIKKITITEHGMNRCYLDCEKGIIDRIQFIGREFGIGEYKIGMKTPQIQDLII